MAKRTTTTKGTAVARDLREVTRRDRLAGMPMGTRRIPDARKVASRKACRGKVAY